MPSNPKIEAIEPEIKVLKIGREWKVEFWIAQQGFQLAYGGTKAEANWMAKMLKNAFSRISPIKNDKRK